MRKNKGIKLSDLKIDPKDSILHKGFGGNPTHDTTPILVGQDNRTKKKVFGFKRKEFVPEMYVVLYTLEGHSTWRIFKGFWSTWEAEKKNMVGTKITASRVFKLVRLTGEFYETPQ